ncbi:hypothetical protein [Streptomyces sp. NPDC020951]|uniref:hypothetical protein n=1 Tax=Streptomyces sp. NPDC020951 TaxID=3365104 RepID=UPI00379667DE
MRTHDTPVTARGPERTRRTVVPVRTGEPAGSPTAAVSALQRTVGNAAVVRLLTAQRMTGNRAATTVKGQPQVQRAPGLPLEEANQDGMARIRRGPPVCGSSTLLGGVRQPADL